MVLAGWFGGGGAAGAAVVVVMAAGGVVAVVVLLRVLASRSLSPLPSYMEATCPCGTPST